MNPERKTSLKFKRIQAVMGGKSSVQAQESVFDIYLSEKLRLRIRNLLSGIEEKTMRILILLSQVNENFTYRRVFEQILNQGLMEEVLEKLDFMATDLNDKLDMLYFDTFELFDEKIHPDDFRSIRHGISGDTYELFKNLSLKNVKGKESK